MKRYIWGRIIRSLISIFLVTSIVIVMLYTMIDSMKPFENDQTYTKMKGDAKTVYRLSKQEELGYLDYVSQAEMCDSADVDHNACKLNTTNSDFIAAKEYYEKKGYTIGYLALGTAYATRNYNAFELLANFWGHFIVIDNKNAVKDDTIERKYYFGQTEAGMPALKCSGCNYKYQVYIDGKFPFIHQHVISLNFGISYPVKAGTPALQVISDGQGSQVQTEQTFPSGKVLNSATILTSCKYKSSLDDLEKSKFNDNYADCLSSYESPSMINTSYIFGILSLILEYLIGLPAGMAMARNKDKLVDKIGIVYINVLIAVPSLAFIFFMKQIGFSLGLPDKFPQLGFGDVRSYIMPVVILGLLGTPGLMMWARRYMIDQSNSDYVKFARAKGLSEREIFRKHILKNAIIPFVNGIPASIILAISGAYITESVFAIPGMGKMLPDSIARTNLRMVICLIFIYTALAVFSVLLGDILMTWIDPRIKLSAGGNE